MKKDVQIFLVLAAIASFIAAPPAFGQGAAFTYQGQLINGTNPVTGLYNFKFDTFNAATGGSVIGGPVTNTAVPVTNGLFTILIDFGTNVFTGPTNWLQVQVTTNGGTNFISLAPRQEMTPTPYAIYAESASNLLGTLSASQLTSGTIPLAQLPGTVVTNNESSSVTLSNVTLSGILSLPSIFTVNAGGSSLLFFDSLDDFYAGPGAGAPTNSGGSNTGIGYNSLGNNSNGTNNTAIGSESLDNNTNGSYNVAAGERTLLNNTSGNDNTAVGRHALEGNTVGNGSTAVGYGALSGDQVGSFNIALGYLAGSAYDSNASNNIDIGNTGITGENYTIHIGDPNIQTSTFIAGVINGNGGGLTNLSAAALPNVVVTNNEQNVLLAGLTLSGTLNLPEPATIDAAGNILLRTDGKGNFFAGYGSGNSATVGSDNTALGDSSSVLNLNGSDNTAIGFETLFNNGTGGFNIALGYQAGINLSAGSSNIDIGNPGVSGENGVIRIGTPGTHTTTFLSGNVALNGALNIDQNGTYGSNNGTVISNALTFGTGPGGSGEGIASQRTSGPNQFDLTLFTGFDPRLTILSSGFVGIGLTNPSSLLEVNGAVTVDSGTVYLQPLNGSFYENDGLSWGTAAGLPGISGFGPFLAGYVGGALGALSPNTVCLSWDSSGDVWVSNNCSVATLTIRGGADLAEPFNISSAKGQAPAGAVVVIDDQNPGHLKLSDQAYDPRVAGVVSGANGIHPGIQMQQQGLLEGGRNVALTGRVYVQADASNGAIRPGDMLTTSANPGYAMKVTDHARAAGAILGKAMTGLSEGKGMVLVLVTLQ